MSVRAGSQHRPEGSTSTAAGRSRVPSIIRFEDELAAELQTARQQAAERVAAARQRADQQLRAARAELAKAAEAEHQRRVAVARGVAEERRAAGERQAAELSNAAEGRRQQAVRVILQRTLPPPLAAELAGEPEPPSAPPPTEGER